MTQREKLLRMALENPGGLRFVELRALAEHLGFVLDRTRGSHFIYTHPELRRPLSFQDVGGSAKPYQVRQLLEAARELGLIEEEF